MLLTVTQADIDQARFLLKDKRKRKTLCCPFAVAASRVFMKQMCVNRFEMFDENASPHSDRYLLSEAASNWVDAFDSDLPVEPGSFELREKEE